MRLMIFSNFHAILHRLTKRVQEEKPSSEFFIDASHELSLFIWHNIRATAENNKLKSRPDVSLRHSTSCQEGEGKIVDEGGGGCAVESPGNTRAATKLSRASGHKLLMAASPYFCRIKRHGCAIYAREPKSTCVSRPYSFFFSQEYNIFLMNSSCMSAKFPHRPGLSN